MIIKTRTGIKVSGTLARDGEQKVLGGRSVFVLNIKAFSEKKDGRWESYFVDAKIWGEHPELEGMLVKGDFVEVEGPEIQDRPGNNGNVFHSITADDVTPGGRVVLRWMQQAIDVILDAAQPQEPPVMNETHEQTPFDGQEENPAQTTIEEYTTARQRESDADLERQLDATEEDDLPF